MEKKKFWKEEVEYLKSIVDKTNLEEKKKWGIPVYTFENKDVVGLVDFKSYFGLWFYNGVFLKDDEELLVNANEKETKMLRQMRFTSKDEIDEDIILSYINEAIEVEKKGLKISPKNDKIKVPDILKESFRKNPELEESFSEFPRYKQNEFMQYLTSAKMDRTREKRLNKISPMILQGIGLNDQYKK